MKEMEKYKHKFEKLISNLNYLGYQFQEEPIKAPCEEAADIIRQIEKEAGIIPMALKRFYLTIGGINFKGKHTEWNLVAYPDPIVIFPIEDVYYEFKDFLADKEYYLYQNDGKFLIPISPDYYHKENVSGGMWYNIPLPNSSEDPVIEDERHKLSFTKYLDHAIENGGFCSLDGNGNRLGYPMDKILEDL